MGTLPRSTKNLTQASNFAPRFPGAHLNIWAAKKQTQLKDSILMIDHFCLLLGGSFEGIRYVCPLQTKTVRNAKKVPLNRGFKVLLRSRNHNFKSSLFRFLQDFCPIDHPPNHLGSEPQTSWDRQTGIPG